MPERDYGIADLILRGGQSQAGTLRSLGEAKARTLSQLGALQAEGYQQSGARAALLAGSLAKIATGAVEQYQTNKLENAKLDRLKQQDLVKAEADRLAALRLDTAANDTHAAAMRTADEAARTGQQRTMLGDFYKLSLDPATGEVRRPVLQQFLANAGMGPAASEIFKTIDEATKANLDVTTARTKADEAELKYGQSLAALIIASGFNPAIIDGILTMAETHGHGDIVKQIRALEQGDPKQFQAFVTKLAQGPLTPSESLAREKFDIEKPSLTPNAQGLTPEQAAVDAREKSRIAIAQATSHRADETFKATYGTGPTEEGGPTVPIDTVAKAIAEYRVPPVSPRSMASGPGKALMERVAQINPDYDATQYANRNKTRQMFTTGTQGQQINAMNTAIGHIDQLANVVADLNNSDLQVKNKAFNWIKSQLGSSVVTNFDTLKDALAGEVSSILSKGQATVSGIAEAKEKIHASNSPEQLAGYVKTLIPLMGSKLDSLNYQYHQAMGEKDPFSALSPESKRILEKHGGAHGPAAGSVSVQGKDGASYTFPTQAAADAFKKAGG